MVVAFAIIAFGIIMIGSASLEYTDASYVQLKDMTILQKFMQFDYGVIGRQLLGVVLGIIGMLMILYIDYEDMGKYTKHLYVFNIIMLLAVFIVGHTALGAQRWIIIGPLQFQPSEIAKIIIIITFADFLTRREGKLNRLRDLIPCFAFVGVPMVLVLAQPDLGTSLVFLAITFGMLFVAGARPALLLGLIGLGIFLGASIYIVHGQLHSTAEAWDDQVKQVEAAIQGTPLTEENNQDILNQLQKNKLTTSKEDLQTYLDMIMPKHEKAHVYHELFHKYTLKEYQMTRIISFVSPESDLQGAGYHVWQSKIALGSGGFFGKGLLEGTQSHFFLPIGQTDFIFSVMGEEFGLMGVLILLTLYFALLYRGIQISCMAKDMFGTLLAIGVVSKFAFHIVENVGMSVGLMPVAGIPLPLFSYGGTNMVANLLAIGLLLNIYVRRQKLLF